LLAALVLQFFSQTALIVALFVSAFIGTLIILFLKKPLKNEGESIATSEPLGESAVAKDSFTQKLIENQRKNQGASKLKMSSPHILSFKAEGSMITQAMLRKQGDEENNENFANKIRLTFKLLISGHMLPLVLAMFYIGLSVSYYVGILTFLIASSVQGDDLEKDSKVGYSMIMIGVGSSLGGLMSGKVIDVKGRKAGIIFNLIFTLLACATSFAQAFVNEFGILCFAASFFWGASEGTAATAINTILGTDFVLKVEPFAVLLFVQSMGTFLGFIAFSFLTEILLAKILTGVMAGLAVVATLWAIRFKFKPDTDMGENTEGDNKTVLIQ